MYWKEYAGISRYRTEHVFGIINPGEMMSKLYGKAVEVRLAGDDLAAFYWRGKWQVVEEGVRHRHRQMWLEADRGEIYRVRVKGGGVYELVKEAPGWILLRVWD